MGRKERAAVPLFFGGGNGSPSNTMWPGLRPTSIPSGILIHPAIWPEYMGRIKKPPKGADGYRRQHARLIVAYLQSQSQDSSLGQRGDKMQPKFW